MPTVLIVDDEQHIRLLIEQTLEELEDEGVELQTASDGEMALDVVRNHHPELVFLDLIMGLLNGFVVCRAM
jgi:CheY-like chemotaxis protein